MLISEPSHTNYQSRLYVLPSPVLPVAYFTHFPLILVVT